MQIVNTIMMYWGYFSFIGLIITLCYCIPFAMKDEEETPYQKTQKYFKKKKREYESN